MPALGREKGSKKPVTCSDHAKVPIEEINEYKVMSHLYIVANKTTVYEMWKAILLLLEKTVTSSAADLRKELFEMRLKNKSLTD